MIGSLEHAASNIEKESILRREKLTQKRKDRPQRVSTKKLKEEAEMIHGSEAYEPLEGWTYNHLLYKLKPQLTNIELANHIVNDYVESYRNGSVYTSYSVTSAVIDTSKLELLWNELNNFSIELKSVDPVYHNQTEIFFFF